MLAHFLDEGEHAGSHHHVIDHLGVGGNLREIFGVGGLGRRNRQQGRDAAALFLDGRREEVAMIVAEGVVREDHGDLLAEIAGDPRRHGADLRADIGDARLEDIAVKGAGGDVIALAHHEIGHLQLAGAGRGADHDMREERAEDEVDLVLAGEFFDHLGTALGIRAVILGDDLDLAPGDAAASLISFAAAWVVRSYQRP